MGSYSYDRDVYSSSSYSNWGSSSYSASKLSSNTLDKSVKPNGKVLELTSKNPIIIVLDVTGSNINFARLVYDKLPMFYGEIEQKGYLDDFDICVCAVGDASSDCYPIQIGSPAKGIEIDSWMEKLVLEGCGGGQRRESYELMAHYLLNSCKFDDSCKPIIFFIGDEMPYDKVKVNEAKDIGLPVEVSYDPWKELNRKFHDNVFIMLNKYNGRRFEDDITKDILSLFYNTYAEKSPSGKGLHIIGKVDLTKIPKNADGTKLNEKYYQKNSHNKIECYIGGLTNRFFTFTENVIVDKPINDCTEQLLTFLDKYMKKETKETTVIADSDIIDMACADILEIIKKSEQAEKFNKLFFSGDTTDYGEDESCADMALCSILAFYCGEDIELIDKLFCGSKLYREKWNRLDYKHSTIKKAIVLCKGKFYKNGVNFRMLEKLKKLTPEKRYSHNDIGMSELFADMFKSQLRYNTTAKQWYYFNGKVWKEDAGAMIARQKMK